MNDFNEILITLQTGHPDYPALDYGLNLAILLKTPVRLLCVQQKGSRRALEAQVEETRQRLEAAGIPLTVIWENGNVVDAVLQTAIKMPQAGLVISDAYRPVWRRWVRFGKIPPAAGSL